MPLRENHKVGTNSIPTSVLVRKDHLFCTRCLCIEPIHPGESGTPLSTYLLALEAAARRHPDEPHENPFSKKG